MALIQRHTSYDRSQTTIIGRSRGIQQALALTFKVAKSPDTTVLIEGETGTGKELIAKRIHELSSRAERPYICLNCGAVTKDLVESELFGYERGTFTGGLQDGKKGKIEMAHGGSILLDEISELFPAAQVKLLRFLEEKEFYRVGGTESKKMDVRVIAATNRSLENDIREGRFRKDLYYRLNVVKIRLPALRDRKADILPLALFFMNIFNKKFGKSFNNISSEATAVLTRYSWPGNVRELRNVIERVVLLEEGIAIQPSHLVDLFVQDHDMDQPACSNKEVFASDLTRKAFERWEKIRNIELPAQPTGIALDELNKKIITQALQLSGGNIARAARLLGISRATAAYRINKYGKNISENYNS